MSRATAARHTHDALRLLGENGMPPLVIIEDIEMLGGPDNWSPDSLESIIGRFCAPDQDKTLLCLTVSQHSSQSAYLKPEFDACWNSWTDRRLNMGRPLDVTVTHQTDSMRNTQSFGTTQEGTPRLDFRIFDKSFFLMYQRKAFWRSLLLQTLPGLDLRTWRSQENMALAGALSKDKIRLPGQMDASYPHNIYLIRQAADNHEEVISSTIRRLPMVNGGAF